MGRRIVGPHVGLHLHDDAFRPTPPHIGHDPVAQEIERHLAFRDYLRTHRARAAAYSNLKRELAEIHGDDLEAYMDGKDDFVKAVEAGLL